MQGFLLPAVWAGIVFIGLSPIYLRYKNYFLNKNISLAVIKHSFFIIFSSILLVHVLLIINIFYNDLNFLINEINNIRNNGFTIPESLRNIPHIGSHLYTYSQENLSSPEKINFLLKTISYDKLITYGKNVGIYAVSFLFKFVVFLISLYFILVNEERLKLLMLNFLNEMFGQTRGLVIWSNFFNGLRGIFNNLVIVSIGEALILFPFFLYFKIPHSILFALITGLVSIIPGLAQTVLVGLSIIVFVLTNKIYSSVIFLIIGIMINALFDNIIRPYLIKKSIKMPISLVIIGILGGLQSFGVLGIFLGPIICGLFLLVVKELLVEDSIDK
jgi:predicted PurR-regulated permease PerM